MAKRTNRFYEPVWLRLKQHCEVQVEITTSTNPDVQNKLIATLRKAIQKEKYNDVNFRSNFPNAKITSTVTASNQTIIFILEKGMQSNSACTVSTLFGEKK